MRPWLAWLASLLVAPATGSSFAARGLRFVVHRGSEGFGDRLQQLLMAVRYARASGRALVLDWRDAKWARNADFDFGDFLSIRGVQVFHVREFLYVWRALKEKLRVVPPMFRHHLEEPSDGHWSFLKFGEENRRMEQIANGLEEDYEEEVVVLAGDQHRYFHYSEIRFLRLQRWMAQKVRRFMQREGLLKNEYVVVHLRGGDKPWKCQESPTWFYQPHQQRTDEALQKWPSLSEYLAYMRNETKTLNPLGLTTLVLSDTPCLRSRWYEELCQLEGRCEAAAERPRPQRQRRLIEASLLDFALMSLAHRVVGDGHSLFAMMAESCRATGSTDLLGSEDTDGPFQGWDEDEWND